MLADLRSLNVSTVPCHDVNIYKPRPMDEAYRRVISLTIHSDHIPLPYSSSHQPQHEAIQLPAAMHHHIGTFIKRFMADYEPSIQPKDSPMGYDQYLCHNFAQSVASGILVNPYAALRNAFTFHSQSTRLSEPEQQLKPGDLGMVVDFYEGTTQHSFISLGGQACLQVMDVNSHIGIATTAQLLNHYGRPGYEGRPGIVRVEPSALMKLLGATPGLPVEHHS